jgi:hypothetical protein
MLARAKTEAKARMPSSKSRIDEEPSMRTNPLDGLNFAPAAARMPSTPAVSDTLTEGLVKRLHRYSAMGVGLRQQYLVVQPFGDALLLYDSRTDAALQQFRKRIALADVITASAVCDGRGADYSLGGRRFDVITRQKLVRLCAETAEATPRWVRSILDAQTNWARRTEAQRRAEIMGERGKEHDVEQLGGTAPVAVGATAAAPLRRDRRRESLLNASAFYHHSRSARSATMDPMGRRLLAVPCGDAGSSSSSSSGGGGGGSNDGDISDDDCKAEPATMVPPPAASAIFRKAMSTDEELENDAAAAIAVAKMDAPAVSLQATALDASAAPTTQAVAVAARRRRVAELAQRRAAQQAGHHLTVGAAPADGPALKGPQQWGALLESASPRVGNVVQSSNDEAPSDSEVLQRPALARKGSTRTQTLRCKGWFVLQANAQQLPRVFAAMRQHTVTRFQSVFDSEGEGDIEKTLVSLGC